MSNPTSGDQALSYPELAGLVLKHAPAAVAAVDLRLCVRVATEEFQSLLGVNTDETLPFGGDSQDTQLGTAIRREVEASFGDSDMSRAEWRLGFAGGLAVSGKRLILKGEPLCLISVERVHATSRMADWQNRERRRLAKQLHQDASQRLVLLAATVDLINAEAGPDRRQDLEKIKNLLKDLRLVLRGVVEGLHPTPLDVTGLTVSLHEFVERVGAVRKGPVSLEVRQPPASIPARIARCVLAVAQEGVMNAVEHAPNSRIRVSLIGGNRSIKLMIEDDGPGFDLPQTAAGHFGITSMSQLLSSVKGSLLIASGRGKGVAITAEIPLPGHYLRRAKRPGRRVRA